MQGLLCACVVNLAYACKTLHVDGAVHMQPSRLVSGEALVVLAGFGRAAGICER